MVDTLDMVIQAHADKEKKKPITYPFTSIKEVYVFGQDYKPEIAVHFYAMYLSGLRVSEYNHNFSYNVSFGKNDYGEETIILNSITLKNRKQPRRILPIPLYGDEKPMSKIFEKYLSTLDSRDKICPLSRNQIWRLFTGKTYTTPAINPKTRETIQAYTFNMHPHFLRHCRASHMVAQYGFGIMELMGYFGWSSPTMPNTYVCFDWRVFTRKFDTKKEEALKSALVRYLNKEVANL